MVTTQLYPSPLMQQFSNTLNKTSFGKNSPAGQPLEELNATTPLTWHIVREITAKPQDQIELFKSRNPEVYKIIRQILELSACTLYRSSQKPDGFILFDKIADAYNEANGLTNQ